MPEEVDRLIDLAFQEDIGNGDITTKAVFAGNAKAKTRFIAKQDGIIAGIELAQHIFGKLDNKIVFRALHQDGSKISEGDLVASAHGPVDSLLTGERTVLNFMQRMSGIASEARLFADAVSHTSCRILDTRKTVPGHRFLDKWAVRLGGGKNHRQRLDDMFLIKENHIAAAGSIEKAIDACILYRKENGLDSKLEIEVKNLEEVDRVITHGKIDFVLLDNMPVSQIKEAVSRIDRRFLTEASGNVTLHTVKKIAETGVDFISAGELTHSVRALDISMVFED